MENTQKTVWVLFENYMDDHENHINTFSSYEKWKEQFDNLMQIWKEQWYFEGMEKEKDYTLSDTYCCMYNTWTEAELFESDLDYLSLKN